MAPDQSSATALWGRLQRRHPFPLTVMVCLTEQCNLRCEHCFLPPPGRERSLSSEALFALMDELSELGVIRLQFTGGEPTLREDLVDLVAHAVRRRFVVGLKTNGTLLEPADAERLARAGLAKMDISIYHPQPEPHDRFVRQEGAWERSMAAARCFAAQGGRVQLSYTITAWNWSEVSPFLELCEGLGYSYLVNPQLLARRGAGGSAAALRPTEEQLRAVLSDERLLNQEALLECEAKPGDHSLCGAGSHQAVIQPNGDVLLCQMLPWPLGNVQGSSFRRIWLDSPVRQRFIGRRFGELPVCGSCELSRFCNRCAANALHEHGDLLGISEADCLVARTRASLAASLEPAVEEDPGKERPSAGGDDE